jgi:hypothetical protein
VRRTLWLDQLVSHREIIVDIVLLAKAAEEPRKQVGLWMVGGRQDGQSDDNFSMADELV